MKKLILGPTFTTESSEPAGDVADRLGAWIASAECPFVGSRQGLHLQLTIARPDRHRWSPWLTIEVREPSLAPMPTLPPTLTATPEGEARPEPGSEVFGRFNPSPAIWTGYMLFSLALITIATGAAMWAMAQWVMKNPPTALWVIPICTLVLVVMWGFSAAGQRLASDEMQAMREAVEGVVGVVGGCRDEP